jgi:hypothetical protein
MQAERACRLELPERDRLDAGAHDLRGVGGRYHRDRTCCRGERGQTNAREGQGIVDDEQQHQHRERPEYVDIGDGEEGDGPRCVEPQHRQRHSRDEADDDAGEAERQGRHQPAQDQRQRLDENAIVQERIENRHSASLAK